MVWARRHPIIPLVLLEPGAADNSTTVVRSDDWSDSSPSDPRGSMLLYLISGLRLRNLCLFAFKVFKISLEVPTTPTRVVRCPVKTAAIRVSILVCVYSTFMLF